MFEPCKSPVCRPQGGHVGADPPVQAGSVGSNQPIRESLKRVGLGQARFEDKREHESVSPPQPATPKGEWATGGSGSVSCQEIQLKSLILAQPERWRRG